jgi:hypothetical protein
MIFGRTYSKTIIQQGDLTTRAGALAEQFVSSPALEPPKPPLTQILILKGDPTTRSGPVPVQFVSSPTDFPAPPPYAKTLIAIGAPTTRAGPLAVQFVSSPALEPPTPPLTEIIICVGAPDAAPTVTPTTQSSLVTPLIQPAPPLAKTIIETGDPTAISVSTPEPSIVQPQFAAPQRGEVILSAAPADIVLGGALVSTPLPQIQQIRSGDCNSAVARRQRCCSRRYL